MASTIVARTLQEMIDNLDGALVDLLQSRLPGVGAEEIKSSLAQVGIKKIRLRGYNVFIELLGKPIKRAELIKKMVKEGFKRSTATSYMNWSNKSLTEESARGYIENPFAFRTVNYKDKDGEKWDLQGGGDSQGIFGVKKKHKTTKNSQPKLDGDEVNPNSVQGDSKDFDTFEELLNSISYVDEPGVEDLEETDLSKPEGYPEDDEE